MTSLGCYGVTSVARTALRGPSGCNEHHRDPPVPRRRRGRILRRHASFSVWPGEILGVVGESGSGKSVTALALLRLIRPPGRIVRGAVRFEGRDLLGLSEDEMRAVRGARIAMVFQSPRTALNPVLTVGRQIARLFELHQGASRAEGWARTIGMLELVGIAEPERRARQYAHQLSGGMCQRVMIAMALATSPRLLVADEPTTGLDVSIAAQILELLRDLGRRTGASILLITRDLGDAQRPLLVELKSAWRDGTSHLLFEPISC